MIENFTKVVTNFKFSYYKNCTKHFVKSIFTNALNNANHTRWFHIFYIFLKTKILFQPREVKVKPMNTDSSKNPFKDGKDEFPVDEALNEIEVLGRYDSILRAFVLRGYFKLYKVLSYIYSTFLFFILILYLNYRMK